MQIPDAQIAGSEALADAPRRSRWRSVAAWGVSLAITAGLLAGAETALRLGGYGHSTRYFVTKRVGPAVYQTPNPWFYQQFSRLPLENIMNWDELDFQVPAVKPANTVRIFVLGSSAIYGPETSSRIFEAMLKTRFPGVRFEVYNAACPGMNSNVMYAVARACRELQPDLFLIYMGNNEAIGPYGATTSLARIPGLWRIPVIRTLIAMNESRLSQLVAPSVDRAWTLPGKDTLLQQMPSMTANARAVAHYRRNVADILATAEAARAKVVLCTLSSNERFGRADAPAPRNDWEHYARSAINRVVLDLAAQRAARGVYLADVDLAVAQQSPDGVPGYDYFCDNVHFTFDGNYVVATTMFDQIVRTLPPWAKKDRAEDGPPPSKQECAERLGWSPAAEVKLLRLQRKIMLDAQSAQVIERKLAALEPRVDADLEKGIAAGYQRAAELDGDDWRLFNHWFQALMDSQQFAEAQRVAQTMTERFPQARASWRAMGQARMARTDPKGAREAFERALALYPDDAASRIGLKGLGKP